jgi:hypothetical protein
VLYAFFDTSVSGAYRSVEALTRAVVGLGGILRTVHRHASDAMVLTMLLHLLRYFAFDRLRGFRWFSWVTGVVLLWLAYVAGANGYMLPWDRLAQFVTQASFEWLDWLPGFGGSLIRNFILPEQRQRPPVLAAGLHPHRRAAGHAAADVGARAARAQGDARSRRGRSPSHCWSCWWCWASSRRWPARGRPTCTARRRR